MNACNSNGDPTSEDFKRIFQDENPTNIISNPDTINIIVDRSASIKGFVIGNDNKFLRTIQDFIQNVPKQIPIIIYQLDNTIQPIDLNLLRTLQLISDVNFFSGSQTDISAILSIPAVQNKHNLTLVFSDWIHSLKDDAIANQMILFSRDLKEFIREDGLFALFGKYVNFNGTYYVECKPPSTVPFTNQRRPFFCIVFGSDLHSEFLQKYIEPFYEKQLVIGLQENVQTQFIPISDFEDHTDPLDSNNIVEIKVLDTDSISFSIQLNQHLKFTHNLIPSIEAYLVTFDSDSIIDKRKITNISVRLDSTKKLLIGEEYFVTLFLPYWAEQKMLCKLSFYQEMPDWISVWSTNCDNNIMEAQKVFQLNRWINDYIYTDLDIRNKTSFSKYLYIWR